MRTLIIEDEALACEKVVDYLNRYSKEFIVLGCLDSVQAAISWLGANEPPDLIFLDIYLADGSCFEIFEKIEVNAPVIFTTAHDQYAIQAFQVNSIDYLLKPLNYNDFAKALLKLEKVSGTIFSKLDNRVKELLKTIKSANRPYKSRFLVKCGERIRYIETGEIAFFYSEDKLTFLVTKQQNKHAIDYSLDGLQSQLDPFLFFRVNRKYLMNIHSIKVVDPFYKGKLRIEAFPASAEDIIVSSEKAKDFKKWLSQ